MLKKKIIDQIAVTTAIASCYLCAILFLTILVPLSANAADLWDRKLYFGDLHVHTETSSDAYGEGSRATIDEAYAFARGAEINIPPFCDGSDPDCVQIKQQLARPLDFIAITDHAEFYGEQDICRDETSDAYDTIICRDFRDNKEFSFNFVWNIRLQKSPKLACGERTIDRFAFCGSDGEKCLKRAESVWKDTVGAKADEYNELEDFTAFIGYEWSGVPGLKNWHRNVIFKTDTDNVPDRPASYFDVPKPEWLWERLEDECIPPACDVLSIPHNSNVSDGLMFTITNIDLNPVEYAALSAKYETLIEVMQHKGDSECLSGYGSLYSTDEECGFEKLPFGNIIGARRNDPDDPLAMFNIKPDPKSFVRYGLKQGLLYMTEPESYLLEDINDYDSRFLGVNPFKYGMISSTDTHLGTAGAVAENNYIGNTSRDNDFSSDSILPDYEGNNSGGLAVLWADENTRDSLFAAMKRREAYATSGPRITLRFFGMWAVDGSPPMTCGDTDFIEAGYTYGVPMGGDLDINMRNPDEVPTFAVYAHKDVGIPGNPNVLSTPLQKIQIIKGWVDEDGPQEIVHTINPASKTANTGAMVDIATCVTSGAGYDELCNVWQDNDFNPDQNAFYYVRVIENPTCRWTTWICKDISDPCSRPEYEECCDPQFPATIQERAWSSPIWYTP